MPERVRPIFFDTVTLSNFALAARAIFRELLRNLGPGEASCIAAAQACAGIVATDDRVARASCTERAIPVTGTIGILRACVRDGTLALADADRILDAMTRAAYRAPIQRISDLA
jgi:predicted nucleic acid-binding protein